MEHFLLGYSCYVAVVNQPQYGVKQACLSAIRLTDKAWHSLFVLFLVEIQKSQEIFAKQTNLVFCQAVFQNVLEVFRLQDDWNLGHAGHIGYLDAIAELVDYRKVNAASESVLRGLASTEIYLKKVRKTVSKMMRLQWTSELDIDALEAKGHWATLEELLEVVGRYLPLREHTEIMQGETGCCFANRFIFCYQIFGRLFIYQGQGLAPHDISVLNSGNGEQSQD